MLCPVELSTNRYLDEQADLDTFNERFKEAIQKRVRDPKDDYFYATPDNIGIALTEVMGSQENSCDNLSKLMIEKDYAALGQAIEKMCIDYQTKEILSCKP